VTSPKFFIPVNMRYSYKYDKVKQNGFDETGSKYGLRKGRKEVKVTFHKAEHLINKNLDIFRTDNPFIKSTNSTLVNRLMI
jgi:hypothetical protein